MLLIPGAELPLYYMHPLAVDAYSITAARGLWGPVAAGRHREN